MVNILSTFVDIYAFIAFSGPKQFNYVLIPSKNVLSFYLESLHNTVPVEFKKLRNNEHQSFQPKNNRTQMRISNYVHLHSSVNPSISFCA